MTVATMTSVVDAAAARPAVASVAVLRLYAVCQAAASSTDLPVDWYSQVRE